MRSRSSLFLFPRATGLAFAAACALLLPDTGRAADPIDSPSVGPSASPRAPNSPPGSASLLDSVPESLRIDAEGDSLDTSEIAKLSKGKILTALIEIEDNPVKKGVAVGIVDAPPAKVFATVGDYENFKEFMPYVDSTTVDDRAGDVSTVSYVLKFPLGLGGREYQLKLTDRKKTVDGVEIYSCEWIYTGKGNIADTTGSWKVTPWGDGSKSFVRYTVFTDPGGSYPNWVKNRAASMALPSVLEAVRDRVASPKAKQPTE